MQSCFLPCVRLLLAVAWLGAALSALAAEPTRPNLVVIYCDDLGYGDIGPFGAKGYATPHLDQMAAEGVRLTDFHTAAAVCSASRAALLTGCYPQRVSILGAFGPRAKSGIHADEKLLSEYLHDLGYATAIFGKWHLGDAPQFLPLRHGFDAYFGLPYSNDMWPHHPTNGKAYPPLPLIEGDQVRERMPDQTQLTTWYTERAVKFIEDHRSQPFFLYVPHSMPHVPLFVSEKFRGKTERGLFGDVIAELDWSVGQILAALRRLQLDRNTLVLFSSDNGPWLSYGDHAGRAGLLREGKGTTWDGGHRVPTLAWAPGRIPAGKTCSELAATIDVLPTFVKLAGGTLDPARKLDGLDIGPLLWAPETAKTPHEAFYYYWDRGLEAVRSGPWKLHFPHGYRTLAGRAGGTAGKPAPYQQGRTELALYHLGRDVGEQKNVATEHPEVVARLQALAEKARADLGDSFRKVTGSGVREPGRLTEGKQP